MATKVFVKGDFRSLFVSEKDSKYKVFYNNKWNNIQSKDSVLEDLTDTEHYIDNYFVKVYDNGLWIDLALLENYYSDFETQKSVFYQLLTKDNFKYDLSGISETNVDFRLRLNNLICILKINENFEFENSDLMVYDSLQAFLGKVEAFLKQLNYIKNEQNNFNNINTFINDEKSTIDYSYLTNKTEKMIYNNQNSFNSSNINFSNELCYLKDVVTKLVKLENENGIYYK